MTPTEAPRRSSRVFAIIWYLHSDKTARVTGACGIRADGMSYMPDEDKTYCLEYYNY